jgi:hypothetical protein
MTLAPINIQRLIRNVNSGHWEDELSKIPNVFIEDTWKNWYENNSVRNDSYEDFIES